MEEKLILISNDILAGNIKKFTDESEHSLEEIAKIIKVTDRQLFRYRTGMSEVPALVLYNLCTVLDKNISDMFAPETVQSIDIDDKPDGRSWKVYAEDGKFIGTFGRIFDVVSSAFQEEFLKEFSKQFIDRSESNTESSINSAFDLRINFENDCPYTPDYHKIHCTKCTAQCNSHDRLDRK